MIHKRDMEVIEHTRQKDRQTAVSITADQSDYLYERDHTPWHQTAQDTVDSQNNRQDGGVRAVP